MNMFDDVIPQKEARQQPAIVQAQPVDKRAYADQKVGGIIKVLDNIDAKINSLANPKKGEENPEAQKQIDALSMKRNNLVKGLTTPEFFSLVKASSFNNGDVFLKGIDPRAYATLPPEEQQRLQSIAVEMTSADTQERVARSRGLIMGAVPVGENLPAQ